MGLVLDLGVLITAERNARPVSDLLATLEQEHGETEVVISSITVIELEHGLHRANTPDRARKRRAYPDTIFVDRLSRFNKIAGEMVPHLKIEEVLREVLGDGCCAVAGVPDERRGERLAVVYVSETVTAAEMIRHLEASGLPALWIPKRDHFRKVAAIPALGSGKVDLKGVRAIAMEQVKA